MMDSVFSRSTQPDRPTRRGLITGLASLIAAPAIIRVAPIMPVKVPLVVPATLMPVEFLAPQYLIADRRFLEEFTRAVLESYGAEQVNRG